MADAGEGDRGGAATAAGGPDRPLALLDHFFRREHGRLVAGLTRRLGAGGLDLAEEAVAEAMARAVRSWPLAGAPVDPAGWLATTAYRCAIDALRRAARADALAGVRAAVGPPAPDGAPWAAPDLEPEPSPFGADDDTLQLVFMCCHPALGRRSRVALTLKAVCGLGVDEIAAALRTTPTAVRQRLTRAKRRLAAADIVLALPSGAALVDRREAVVDTLWLLFNEGYSPSGGDAALRRDLVDEAIRLAGLLRAHPAGNAPHVAAFQALLLLTGSRLDARLDADGVPLPLAEQDRRRWDHGRIAAGLAALAEAAAGDVVTEFHLLAGIAACHAVAADDASTDWRRIVVYYDLLESLSPTPIVRLNRAVAVGRAVDPAAALALLDALDDDALPPDARHQREAARAACLARLGDPGAAAAYRAAAAGAPTAAARRALARQADALG